MYEARLLRLEDRDVLWIPTYHQTNYGKFNKERVVAYPWYYELAHQFLLESTIEA